MQSYTLNRPDGALLCRVLEQHTNDAAGAILRLAWMAGLMRDEIQHLTWAQVDLLGEQLLLPDRAVPLAPELAAWLEALRRERNGSSERVVLSDRDQQPLEAQSISGDLLTNIFAGGTVDTEWCFLTGYSQYEEFRNDVDSYVWYFDRQGYQTRGGHPGFGWFYNRQNVNQFLGFQEYWFTENHYGELVDPVEAQWNSDLLLVDEIVKDLRSCLDGEGRPVFSFSVSYQNHGPYEWTYTANETYLDPKTSGLPEESCYVFNNYLHGVNITISAMTLLAQQLEEMEEPVVLVLFGDHKPWGGNSNDAYYGIGASFDTTTLEGFYQYYSTPYLIWANSAAKETLGRDFQGEGGDFSPCFLMPELFEQCGWTGPSFLQLAQEVREVTPLVHQQGVYLTEDGQLTDHLSGEAADRLNEFFFAQYYREHKVVPEGAG